MSDKNTKGIIVVVAVIAMAAGVYYLTHNKKIMYAKAIAKYTGSGYGSYLTMDEEYLKERYKALRKKSPDFTYKDVKYSTETGKKIV